VNVNVTGIVDITGEKDGLASAIRSQVGMGTVGNGGTVTVAARRLNILNGAEATVSNLGRGDAGNLKVTTDLINLNNQGKLTAESVTGRGGDIGLQATDLLVLRRNSLISAISGVPGNDGRDGNINVDTKYLIAVPSENSDIVATGFGRSPGSNIQVNAQGIFGTRFRGQQTSESDIVATGTVTLNVPNVNPSQGLVQLPTFLVNVPRLIASSCSAFGKKGSEFIVTGRGGLPLGPDDFLGNDVVWSDTRLTALPVSSSPRVTPSVGKTSSGVAIVPATGWVFDEKKGEVTLIASSSSSSGVGSNPVKCVVP
jgi:large exoprotein involved in heme utilization and adhesion